MRQAPSGHIPFTPPRQEGARALAPRGAPTRSQLHREEHILLGLIREGEGVAAQVLVKLGADLARVRRAGDPAALGLRRRRQGRAAAGQRRGRRGPASGSLVLDQFGATSRGRPREEARPGHRAREGDRAGDAGALPPHEEQPRADR